MAFFKASKIFKPSGTKSITSNGTHDVTDYASASVNVSIRNSNISYFGNIEGLSNITTGYYPVYINNLNPNGIKMFIAFSREDIRDYTFIITNGTILDIAPSGIVSDMHGEIFLKACIFKPTSATADVDFKKNGSNPSEATSFIMLDLN